jgi:hypothetical protein
MFLAARREVEAAVEHALAARVRGNATASENAPSPIDRGDVTSLADHADTSSLAEYTDASSTED